MPHKCTECGQTYADGSEDVLSGCTCGSRKFEFVPTSELKDIEQPLVTQDDEWIDTDDPKHPSQQDGDPLDELEDSIIIADEGAEDESQHKARSEVVSRKDLPNTPTSPSDFGDSQKNIDEVKRHLHDQFEGIRILEPGQYQLNLMKLFKKQECVISLQEDGRYIINVPGMMESDHDTDPSEE